MAYDDFQKRVQINVRERPTSSDLNAMQNRIYESVRCVQAMAHGEAYSNATSPDFNLTPYGLGPQGFHQGLSSFRVVKDNTNPPFGVFVNGGLGLARTGPATATDIDSASKQDWTQSGSLSAPLVLGAAGAGFTVPAPPAIGNARIDIIEVRPNYSNTDPATVGIFNTATEVFDPATRSKSMDWDLAGLTGTVISPAASTAAISYKTGVSAVGGLSAATEPSVTAGYIKIARINVIGGITSILTTDIADLRPLLWPQGIFSVAGSIVIPGIVAGLATSEAVQMLAVPPGVCVKVFYQNNIAPSAGTSYTAQVYVFGGDLTPRTTQTNGGGATLAGVVSATHAGSVTASVGSAPRCVTVSQPVVGRLDSVTLAILTGGVGNYTVLNGTATFATGQPYVAFTVTVHHPAGSALNNLEAVNFNLMMSMA